MTISQHRLQSFLLGMLASFFGFHSCFAQAPASLLPFLENGKWGYVNSVGKITIPPQFEGAKEFSEGLAAVRINGRYGYLDANGRLQIPAKFDYGEPFDGGTAKAYIARKPYFIDRQGIVLFDHNFASISKLYRGECAIAITPSGKYGLVNRQGELVLDTIYGKINDFRDGRAVVYPRSAIDTGICALPMTQEATEKMYGKGIINTKGEFVSRMGSFREISDFHDGLAWAIPFNYETKEIEHLIDTSGRILYANEGTVWEKDKEDRFFEGFAMVRKIGAKRRYVVIDKTGKIVIDDPKWTSFTPFGDHRAFAKDTTGFWHLIDEQGAEIGAQTFESVGDDFSSWYSPFWDGRSLVSAHGKWCLVSTEGKIQYPPKPIGDEYEATRLGDWVLFEPGFEMEDTRSTIAWHHKSNKLYPNLNPSKWPYSKPAELQKFAQNWNADLDLDPISKRNVISRNYFKPYKPVNVDYMSEVMCRPNTTTTVANSQNMNSLLQSAPSDKFSIQVAEENVMLDGQNIRTNVLLLANKTDETIHFAYKWGNLDLRMEAQDERGQWRDIETLSGDPSYGPELTWLQLEPNEKWQIFSPIYEGGLPTQMRFKVLCSKYPSIETAEYEYSESFPGSINPAQFWRKTK